MTPLCACLLLLVSWGEWAHVHASCPLPPFPLQLIEQKSTRAPSVIPKAILVFSKLVFHWLLNDRLQERAMEK